MNVRRTRQIYSVEHADELRRIFSEATPPNQRMSMRALIGELAEDIRAMRERGYTIDEICQLVTGADEFKGIAQSTLRRYLSAATGKRRPRRRDTKGRVRPATPAPDTAAQADAAKADPDHPSTSGTQRRGEFRPIPDREDL